MGASRQVAVARVLAVAALVLLAGCGVFGGGGGNATTSAPTLDAETDSGSTPTAERTPTSTPTAAPPAPTATPLPPSFETVTVSNASLGLTLELVADASLETHTGDLTGRFATAPLDCARASPFVGVATAAPVADVTVRMAYDPSRLPGNASETDLAVFAYNRTVERFVPTNGSVDAANDTVLATEADTSRNLFERDGERLRVTLDGSRLDTAFVVMHEPTYRAAVESGTVPDQCSDGEGEQTDPPGGGTATTDST